MKTKAEREAEAAAIAEQAALNAARHTSPALHEENLELVGDTPPVYETDAEIVAARGMYGHSYDTLIEQGRIIAPTSEELAARDDDTEATRGAVRKRGTKKGAKRRSR